MVDQIKLKVTVLLPSTNAVWGNVMFYTCQSLCSRGGGSTPLHAGIHTHPGQTSPRQTSPWAADTSEADTQLGRHTHLPWADTPPADTTTTHPLPPTPSPILRNTVNKRPVRIYWNAYFLLEFFCFHYLSHWMK